MSVLNIVRGRLVGNSVVLTAPRESENKYFTFSVNENTGVITYTPIQPKHDGGKNHRLEL